MRKIASRVCLFLLIITFAVSLLPANLSVSASEGIYVDSWNTTLRDNIAVNFILNIPQDKLEGAEVVIEVDDEVFVTESSELVEIGDKYKATVAIAPAQMTDDINLSVKHDGVVVHSAVYTVRQYVDHLVNSPDYSVADKRMAIALLQYGAACQTYFEHNTDYLANSGYESYFIEGRLPESAEPLKMEGVSKGIYFKGSTLLYKDRMAVRFYFELKNDATIDEFLFSADGVGYEPVEKDEGFYIQVPVESPQNYYDPIMATVVRGDENISITYSPMTYVMRMKDKGSPESITLMKALCAYYEAAKTYVSSDSSLEEITLGNIAGYEGMPTMVGNEATEIHFTAEPNDIPIGTEFTNIFTNCVTKMVSSEWSSLGNVTVTKETDTIYTIRGSGALEQDLLRVQGEFYSSALNKNLIIPLTFMYINTYGDGIVQVSCNEIARKELYVIDSLTVTDNDGMTVVFEAPTNDAPFSENFEVFYYPNSTVATLTRNGETTDYVSYDLGIYKISETSYWMAISYSEPLLDGDVLTLNGNFYCGDIILHFTNIEIIYINS